MRVRVLLNDASWALKISGTLRFDVQNRILLCDYGGELGIAKAGLATRELVLYFKLAETF